MKKKWNNFKKLEEWGYKSFRKSLKKSCFTKSFISYDKWNLKKQETIIGIGNPKELLEQLFLF